MKKAISAVICIVLTFGIFICCEATVYARDKVSNGFSYVVQKDGTVKIKKYLGKKSKVSVPEAINGKKVTVIGKYAFEDKDNITGVSLPDSVNAIGTMAFYGCTGLKSINLPSELQTINTNAFSACTELSEVKTGSKLKYIDSGAFLGTKIMADDSNWSDGAFYIGKYLIKINKDYDGALSVKKGTLAAANGAFSECKSITKIRIPKSLKSFSEGGFYTSPFYGCTSLEEINADKDNRYYSTAKGVLFNRNKTRLITYPSAKQGGAYNIPESVTVIGRGAFYFSKIEEITIAGKVKTIEAEAFNHSELSKLTLGKSVKTIKQYAFYNCEKLLEVTVPKTVKSIGNAAFGVRLCEYDGEDDYDFWDETIPEFALKGYLDSAAEKYCNTELSRYDTDYSDVTFIPLDFKAPKISKAESGKNSLTIYFNKVKRATHYEIKYSHNDEVKVVRFKALKAAKKAIKKLDEGEYSVCIRAVRVSKYGTASSKWSNPKAVTIE